MSDWIAIAIAIFALGISAWTHFDTRPRLKVIQSSSIVFYPADHDEWPSAARSMLIVRVVNNGAQPTQIGSIRLGGNHQGLQIAANAEGPQVPYVLEGRGGQVSWKFDYQKVLNLVRTNYHDGEVTLQGVIEVGSRKMKARPKSKVLEFSPDKENFLPPPTAFQKVLGKISSLWSRLKYWIKSLFKHPVMGSSTLWFKEEDIDMENGLMRHKYRAVGPWPVPPHHLVAVARVPSSEGWPTIQRVWDVSPVRIPFCWPGKVKDVWVPILPSEHTFPPGTTFSWKCERGGWHGTTSYGAHTFDDLENASEK